MFDQCIYWINDKSACLVKLTSLTPVIVSFQFFCRYVTSILKICMKDLILKNNILQIYSDLILAIFNQLHIAGVYCKPRLQPISCFNSCGFKSHSMPPLFQKHVFLNFQEIRQMSIILFFIATRYIQRQYQCTVIAHGQRNFIHNIAGKSAKSDSLKKAISIIQNHVKVIMVIYKKARDIETWKIDVPFKYWHIKITQLDAKINGQVIFKEKYINHLRWSGFELESEDYKSVILSTTPWD